MRNENKSPLSGYYGGKHRIAREIISFIPKHSTYIEPFFGGGSVFFLKNFSYKEIINDKDNQLYRFWKVCKNNAYELFEKLNEIDFSSLKEEHKRSIKVIKGETKEKNEIDFAYLLFINLNCSYDNVKNNTFRIRNKNIRDFKREYRNKLDIINNMILRLKNVDIYNKDATWCIKRFDSDKSFFYLDPPYPLANQGHYSGYSIKDFNNLCHILKKIKGKFILSCYIKKEFQISPNWKIEKISTSRAGFNLKNNKLIRMESLIRNF